MRHAGRALNGRAPARFRRLVAIKLNAHLPEEQPSEFMARSVREVYALPHFTVHSVEIHDDLEDYACAPPDSAIRQWRCDPPESAPL